MASRNRKRRGSGDQPVGASADQVRGAPMQRARIDEHGLLIGYDGGDGTGNGPEVPLPCDLAPYRYRWDAQRKTWLPLGRIQGVPGADGRRVLPPVDATVALTKGLMALFEAMRVAPPEYTQRYFDWFRRASVDGKEK